MNCTGVASKNCHTAGSIQCWPSRSASIGKVSGADKASPTATGAKPAHGELSTASMAALAARGS